MMPFSPPQFNSVNFEMDIKALLAFLIEELMNFSHSMRSSLRIRNNNYL